MQIPTSLAQPISICRMADRTIELLIFYQKGMAIFEILRKISRVTSPETVGRS
jgi:hypothetical protein